MNCTQANKLPICAVAEGLGFKLKALHNNNYQIMADTSLVLNSSKNNFNQFGSTGKSGGVINLVQILLKTDSIKEVLRALEGLNLSSLEGKAYTTTANENRGIEWPKRSEASSKALNYLTGRGIDKDLINNLLSLGWAYQSFNNYVVFVERLLGDNVRVGFEARALENQKVKHMVSPRAEGLFWIGDCWAPESVYMFESAIDLLSYLTLNKRAEKGLYVSCRSVNNVDYFTNLIALKYNSIKKIYCCFDNDEAGIKGYETVLNNKGIDNVSDIKYETPKGAKDWNEFLLKAKEGGLA